MQTKVLTERGLEDDIELLLVSSEDGRISISLEGGITFHSWSVFNRSCKTTLYVPRLAIKPSLARPSCSDTARGVDSLEYCTL